MNPAAKSVRVLLVDDNPLVRDLMARSLEPICNVSIAADGADALLQAVDDPPGPADSTDAKSRNDRQHLCEINDRASARRSSTAADGGRFPA